VLRGRVQVASARRVEARELRAIASDRAGRTQLTTIPDRSGANNTEHNTHACVT